MHGANWILGGERGDEESQSIVAPPVAPLIGTMPLPEEELVYDSFYAEDNEARTAWHDVASGELRCFDERGGTAVRWPRRPAVLRFVPDPYVSAAVDARPRSTKSNGTGLLRRVEMIADEAPCMCACCWIGLPSTLLLLASGLIVAAALVPIRQPVALQPLSVLGGPQPAPPPPTPPPPSTRPQPQPPPPM